MSEDDEQYQKATKAVDDAMRTDILGPKVCKVLNEHLPTNELLEEKFLKFINENPKAKTALGTQIADSQSVRWTRWVERIVLVVGGGIVYWIGQLLIAQWSS